VPRVLEGVMGLPFGDLRFAAEPDLGLALILPTFIPVDCLDCSSGALIPLTIEAI